MFNKILLSEKVAESIIDAIKKDFFPKGSQLPNELELAEELGVSRATLREAIKVLESKNVLTVKRGIGTFVSDFPGFSRELLGLRFIELDQQKNDINKLMRHMDYQIIDSIDNIEWNTVLNNIEKNKLGIENSSKQLTESIFNALESFAKSTQADFNHRMLLILHHAFMSATNLENKKMNDALYKDYMGFFNAVERRETIQIGAYYDAFFNRIIIELD